MSEKWKCPRCDAPVDDLRYAVSTSGTEYGTATLSDVNEEDDRIVDHDYSDTGDTNWEGDCEYECPHCDRNVDPNDLIWIGDGNEDEDEDDPEESKEPGDLEASHDIIKPAENIIEKTNYYDKAARSSIICKECRHVLVSDADNLEHGYRNYRDRDRNEPEEFFVVCSQCNHINSTIEFTRLLREGYFNQINNNDNAKNRKNKHRSRAVKSKSR